MKRRDTFSTRTMRSLPRGANLRLLLLILSASSCLAPSEVLSLSYLDEYLVPSAKFALSRLQETFQGVQQATVSTSEKPPVELTAAVTTARSSFTDPVNQKVAKENVTFPDLSPERNLLQASGAGGSSAAVASASVSSTMNSSNTTIITTIAEAEAAAAAATTTTTTTTIITPTSYRTGAAEQPAQSSEAAAVSSTPSWAEATAVDGVPSLAGAEEGEGGVAASSAVLRASEAAELEAVQAVDASIGFGLDLFGGAGPGATDSCYDEYGNARYCEPPFENAAFERPVEVSSVCGSPPSRFCTAYNDQLRNCHMCNAANPKKAHPAAYLTDAHNPLEPSCWVSGPLASGLAPAEGWASRVADNVSVQLNLNKRYEIVYVSLQFCSAKPDSLAIYKSNDFGLSWRPYQFYSSHCERLYGRQPAEAGGPSRASKWAAAPEAECSGAGGPSGSRVAFSPLENGGGTSQHQQLSGPSNDNSSSLQDWISATNIRISLDRHQASWLHSSAASAAHPSASASTSLGVHGQQQQAVGANSSTASGAELTSPSDSFNYALADLTVGARCKCNGHASRCVHNVNGQFQCDCRHNTAGPDCERCAPFHFDRPWARATLRDASPCQPCNCNGHSRKCVFDAELYQLSGKRSGGVCMNCRDNTAGRFCHYCKEGFTRDHSRSMSDKDACKHCDCHPIGSLGRVCNQTTGQCPCKEGVAGTQCNLCAPGYQQSSSLTEPCIKLPENDINYDLINTGSSLSATQTDSATDFSSAESPSGGARQPPDSLPSLLMDNDNESIDTPKAIPVDQPSLPLPPPPPPPPPMIPMRRPGNWRSRAGEQNLETGRRHRNNNNNNYQQNPESYADPSNYPRYSMNPPVYSAADNDQQYYEDHDAYPMHNVYYPANQPHRRIKPQHYGQSSSSRRARPPTQPLLSVDRGNQDDSDQANLAAPEYRDQLPLYPDQFNVIYPETPRRLPFMNSFPSSSRSSSPTGGRSRQQFKPKPELSCNDCQSSIKKKPSYRQFCHSKFVIKAIVMNLLRSDDWTRVDVEVQDIFKSFGMSSLASDYSSPALSQPRSSLLNDNLSGDSFLDNNLQSPEDLRISANNSSSLVTSSLDGAIDSVGPPSSRLIEHRIKIGTIQTVWVPTEDLECKCPRLKESSTYLLMGSIEARRSDSAANSLQLDRHGVALEWKPVFLERITRYQLRQNGRGRCSARI